MKTKMFYIITNYKMKKLLTTLWLIWMLSWSPKAQAGITPKTEETKKDLIEAITTEQATPEEDGKTITFQEAQKTQEQQLFEEIMENEKVQELINEYWQEEIEKTIREMINSEETKEVIDYLLSDQRIQRALKEWDWKAFSQRMLNILRVYYGVKIINKIFLIILGIMGWIYWIKTLKNKKR